MHEDRKEKKYFKASPIAMDLRQRIVKGEFRPGDRLPTQEELKKQTGAAMATIQKVFDTLAAEGFIGTRSPAGTFVAESPPCLSRYGIVFSGHPFSAPPDGTLMSTLAMQCRLMEQKKSIRMALFFGIDGHTDGEDYAKVIADLESHRLTGLLLGSSPRLLMNTPLIERNGIPRAIVGGDPSNGIPAVTMDSRSWIRTALDEVARKGRRRVAVVSASMSQEWFTHLESELARRNLTTKPQWRILLHPGLPESARNAVHLLTESREAPDALLLADDVFVNAALTGILNAGLRIGKDIEVIAHCNFPLLQPDIFPVRRVGFSVPGFLEKALELIDLQKQGVTPESCAVPAILMDDAAISQDAV